jgi:hypothetical protein
MAGLSAAVPNPTTDTFSGYTKAPQKARTFPIRWKTGYMANEESMGYGLETRVYV